MATVHWVSTFSFPQFESDYLFVALRHPDEYPFNEGRLVSNQGLDIGVESYDQHFIEEQVEHSNALHSVLKDSGPYFVGPLARYSLNFDRFPPLVQEAARAAGLGLVCRNPFQSIVVRSLEILFACDEALRIIQQYEEPEKPALELEIRAGTGYACTEAPRGILYHRYRIDEHGTIFEAKIVPLPHRTRKQSSKTSGSS